MSYQKIKKEIKKLQDEFCPEPLSEATSKQLIVRAVLEEVLEVVEEEEKNSSTPGEEDNEYIRKDTILDWAKKQANTVERLNGRGAMLKAWDTLIENLKSTWGGKKHFYVVKDGNFVSDYNDYEKAKTHAESIGGEIATADVLPMAPQPNRKKGVKDAYDISAEYGRASEY